MSVIRANFSQSPNERLRYVLDQTLFLADGEGIVSIVVVITPVDVTTPLVINGLALFPPDPIKNAVLAAAYFCSGGNAGETYEVQFLTTTTLGQVLEDVVRYTLRSDL